MQQPHERIHLAQEGKGPLQRFTMREMVVMRTHAESGANGKEYLRLDRLVSGCYIFNFPITQLLIGELVGTRIRPIRDGERNLVIA